MKLSCADDVDPVLMFGAKSTWHSTLVIFILELLRCRYQD